MSEPEHWQTEGGAAEFYERYLVPTITCLWAADLLDRARPRRVKRCSIAQQVPLRSPSARRITTNTLNFGSVGVISANVDGSTNLAPVCTNGTP
jgi:spore coat protein U-like protein